MAEPVLLYCKKMIDGEFRSVSWDDIDVENSPKVEIRGVEFVKVVRCKDCIYWNKDHCEDFQTTDQNGYCSWGERHDS